MVDRHALIFTLSLVKEPINYLRMDFDSAFKKYHHRLFLFALKFVEHEGDALDIVQNVFLSVWENDKIRLEERMVQAYLFNAVKNCCLNHIKHRKVVRKFEQDFAKELKEVDLDQYRKGERSIMEDEDLQQLSTAVDSLKQRYKEVIVLSRYEGLKNQEIASQLNIPVRTVETRIYRALTSLKEKLSSRSFVVLFSVLTSVQKKTQKT